VTVHNYKDLVEYCGLDNLQEGLEELYEYYIPSQNLQILNKEFLQRIIERFHIPVDKATLLQKAVQAIETDDKLAQLSDFLIRDMCSARNRCDVDNYHNMTPTCMESHSDYYSLIMLLACVEPSMEQLKQRGVPEIYYENIPFRPMEVQLRKFIETGDVKVEDFPWDMNFYTCAIFLFDRFFFIPYRFEDKFKMFRNNKSNKVMALSDAEEVFRRDGQVDGINGVFDVTGHFKTVWQENDCQIIANPINPMGFVEQQTVTLDKAEWYEVLKPGDLLLGWHIPSGPGYTPERLKNSMELALEFYNKYFSDMQILGFWSESWLYDSRLSLMLPEESNIISMQRQFYIYPINEGDGMLRYEVFGDFKADPSKVELKTSLQKKAAAYMKNGARFNTPSMVLLREEIALIGKSPYITVNDVDKFQTVVDSHLDRVGLS
jgi:hypothetical protein